MLRDVVGNAQAAPERQRRRASRRAHDPALPSHPPGAAIRPARPEDLDAIVALDAGVTGVSKSEYWRDQLLRCGRSRRSAPLFLVTTSSLPGGECLGFVLGEVRAWEFGSEPCGWVYAIAVNPSARQSGLGAALLQAIMSQFRERGVAKVRTMVARDDRLLLLFFRAAGMSIGPYLELASDIGAGTGS